MVGLGIMYLNVELILPSFKYLWNNLARRLSPELDVMLTKGAAEKSIQSGV